MRDDLDERIRTGRCAVLGCPHPKAERDGVRICEAHYQAYLERERVPEVGVRYRVCLEDCCIEGEFEATCVGREDSISFDNGVVLWNWSGVRFEAVPEHDEGC